jgi:phage terminase small subunit
VSNIRSPDKETIKKAYETGKYTFKKLSEEYGISLGTIKSWAKRDKDNGKPWIKNKTKKVATKSNKVATKNKVQNIKKEPIVEEVKEVLENTELTDKQRLFCIYYIKYFNGTKAAIKAGYSKDTATEQGSRLLSNVKVQAEIKRLKAAKFKGAFLEKEDLLQKYIDIAFSDITDYVRFGRKEIEVDKDNNPVMVEINYVDFKDSDKVDGTIISEVSQGKNGVSIKLQDKMKALKWLSEHMDLTTEEQRLKIEKLKAEIESIKNNKESQKSSLAEAVAKKMQKRKENKNV